MLALSSEDHPFTPFRALIAAAILPQSLRTPSPFVRFTGGSLRIVGGNMFKTTAEHLWKIQLFPGIERACQILCCCHPCHALWEAAEVTLILSQFHAEADLLFWVPHKKIDPLSKLITACANVGRPIYRAKWHLVFEELHRLEAGLPESHEDFGVVDARPNLALADVKARRVEPGCLSELEEEAGSEERKLNLPYFAVVVTSDDRARESLHGL